MVAVRRAAVAGAVLAYALVAATCRPLTWPALVAVLIPGVPLVWLGLRREPADGTPLGRRSVAVWLGLLAVGGIGELVLRLGPNDLTYPTLSTLADPALATYAGRVVGYVLWIGTGLWLVRR
jgi:hypothetical protein